MSTVLFVLVLCVSGVAFAVTAAAFVVAKRALIQLERRLALVDESLDEIMAELAANFLSPGS